jgi:hypothetical protein
MTMIRTSRDGVPHSDPICTLEALQAPGADPFIMAIKDFAGLFVAFPMAVRRIGIDGEGVGEEAANRIATLPGVASAFG